MFSSCLQIPHPPSLRQQTIKQVTCTYLFVGKDGQMDTSTWEKVEVPVPYAVIPCFTPLNAGELNSACCDVQFVSADSSSSQSEPVDIRRDIPGMIWGPESRLETVETHQSTHKGFPYYTSYEESFTDIQLSDCSLWHQKMLLIAVTNCPSIHPSSTAYPWPGRGGSSLSRDTQTSLSPDTSSSSSGGIPRRSQASRET